MTSYKAKTITMNEWREIMQVPAVWSIFMGNPERLSVHEITDFVYGAKFFPNGEEEGTMYYTLVGVYPKQQVLVMLERTPNGKLKMMK